MIGSSDGRREDVRRADLNGLDGVEIEDCGRTLVVSFLGKAPEALAPANLVVRGGVAGETVPVRAVAIERNEDPERDDAARIRLERAGDLAPYTLSVVDVEGFDPRYATARFSFHPECPTEIDCRSEDVCPPPAATPPTWSYLAKDYQTFRRLLLDRLALTQPGWVERHAADGGIMLVELLAYAGDRLSYLQDAVATEAYLETARLRTSVRRHARLVDYAVHEGCNARAWLCLDAEADGSLPAATSFDAGGTPFTVLWPHGDVQARAAHSTIRFWTWGDHRCCLPAGAVGATLRDAWCGEAGERALALRAGDVLVLEEVRGARTGEPADADLTHRHVVRLTSVRHDVDRLYDQPVLEVRWAAADALPFPLCLSSVTAACEPVEDVAVAHGNVVLVEHGAPAPHEPVGTVGVREDPGGCDCHGRPAERTVSAAPFAPAPLARAPLTFSEPLPTGWSAGAAVRQDPRRALPHARLIERPPGRRVPPRDWRASRDLLGEPFGARVFDVDLDDAGVAHLRFDASGATAAPRAGSSFTAHYRTGNGSGGNVAAEAITEVVAPVGADATWLRAIRNPLPATGGTEREPVADVRVLAPTAFRRRLERAITAEDYARLAERDPRVQRAAAALRWTGAWVQAHVAIDPVDDDPTLLADIAARLERYRRIGHDLRVAHADTVALDLGLHVCVAEGELAGHVRARVLARLRPGPGGLFDPANLTFGTPIAVSRIVAAVQPLPGVESVTVTRLDRLGEPPSDALTTGVLALRPLEVARLDDDPARQDRGRITLVTGGGR